MIKLLYLVRTEADFERVISLAIAGKGRYRQKFIFTGDFSPFSSDGLHNIFQKTLFTKHGFVLKDFCDYDFIGYSLKKMCRSSCITFKHFFNNKRLLRNKKLLVKFFFFTLFCKYLNKNKHNIVKKILNSIKPDVLLTDQSLTNSDYLPEIFRKEAMKLSIPSCIFTHGSAGGLHRIFSDPQFVEYKNYYVFACNTNETDPSFTNRIILGDMSSSFPYVHYLNQLDLHELNFYNNRKFKIGFFVGGTGPFTSTTGWYTMEEIIIDLSENPNVAMILKLHPREEPFIDLRMLCKFDNLLIVNKETDRSRVTKWANIVVCSDHCSTIFEPMILEKKVVAIEGRHIPKYRNKHSPLKNSSVNFISSANEFELPTLKPANPTDSVTNNICWGNNGKKDLAELFFKKVEDEVLNKKLTK